MEINHAAALVTGGAQGMGRVFVEQLKAAGAKVAFCDWNPEGVAEASEALGVPVCFRCVRGWSLRTSC